MNPDQDKRRRFVMFKIRYCALALVWLTAVIATYLYWQELGWPARAGLTALLGLATPSISDVFQGYERWCRESSRDNREKT